MAAEGAPWAAEGRGLGREMLGRPACGEQRRRTDRQTDVQTFLATRANSGNRPRLMAVCACLRALLCAQTLPLFIVSFAPHPNI